VAAGDEPNPSVEVVAGNFRSLYDEYGMVEATRLIDSYQKDFFTDVKLTYRTTFSGSIGKVK